MSKEASTSKEPIHSGHFMTSNPHEVKADEDEDFAVDVVDVDDSMTETEIAPNHKIVRPDKDEKPVTFYKFGPEKTQSIAIDVSLNKLKKCINVAYMKLTTPKWKDFKGLKLQWKHRIRLNNVIWRAYYMEFRKPDKKKKYCYFTVPDDDTTHTKLEGTVLEGMYWKRRMEAVCAQYKKWRTFNRPAKKINSKCCRKRETSCTCYPSTISRPHQSRTPQNLSTYDDLFDADDEFDNEFTNSLFESLNVPFVFPTQKEVYGDQTNADIMQPSLLSLQPSIEEIMAGDMMDGMDMQQHQMMRNPQLMNGHQHMQMQQQQQQQHHYRQKEYYNGSNGDYNNLQPTRQSSTVQPNGLSTQHNQPLYSRAIYIDSAASVQTASPQPFANDDTGRSSSTLSFGSGTPQPNYMPNQILPVVSGGAVLQPVSSTFVNHHLNASSPFFQNPESFRNRFMLDTNPQLIHQQQIQSQNSQWNFPQLHPQQYNLDNRRTIQMLQSPGQNSPMGMNNNGLSFGSPNPLINLSTSPSLSNFIQNQHFISHQAGQIMQGSPVLTRYLATNSLYQQPQQPTALPGLSSKPNGLGYQQDQNSFIPQVKMEAKPFHHQMIPESPGSADLYRPMSNTPSAGPSSATSHQQQNSIFTVPDNKTMGFLRNEINDQQQQQNPENKNIIFLRNEISDPQQHQNAEQPVPPASFPPANSRFRKRPLHSVSNRASPNYTQAASTSSSEAMLSDSEAGDDKSEPRAKRRHNSIKTEVDDSLMPEERKRILHLNAEKNRRNALKDGFESLTSVIPVIDEAGIKPTNAVVLNRAANFIRSLKDESDNRKKDVENCKEKIDRINARIAMLQANMPSSCHSNTANSSANIRTQIEQAFEKHIKERARVDHRYWLLGQMVKPLIHKYAQTVRADTDCSEKIIESVELWLSQHWNLTELRPLASKLLIYLATDLHVLKNSSALTEHVAKEIEKS